MIRLLLAGDFDPEYNRTKILLTGLNSFNSVEVLQYRFCNKREFNLVNFKELESQVDVIFLPSFSHSTANLIIAKAQKKVIFDPLISKYLTKVFDYKLVRKNSVRGLKNFRKDQLPIRNCDHLIADTYAHKKYYSKTFKISLDKIFVLPVGVDCKEFRPQSEGDTNSKYVVGFYGGFIPLQGVRVILEAAKQLSSNLEIEFHLIGTGFEFEKMKKVVDEEKLKNVRFLGWLNPEELPEAIAKFDLCLGIFGDTLKAKMVIPNKIYHYAAMAKPIVTMDSPAIKEVFTDQENIILIHPTGKHLAEEIVAQKNSVELSKAIGKEARKLMETECDSHLIAKRLVDLISTVV